MAIPGWQTMKALSLTLTLAVALAGFAIGPTMAPAQDAKTEGKEPGRPKAANPPGTVANLPLQGVVEIAEGKDGKFRFSVRDGKNKYVGGSGPIGFASKEAAAKAVQSLKDALANAKVTFRPGKDAGK